MATGTRFAKPKVVETNGEFARVQVEIPPMDLRVMMVKIIGKTPLITNRVSEDALEGIEESSRIKPGTGKKARDPEREYRGGLYLISGDRYGDPETWRCGFPGSGVYRCLVEAGRYTNLKMTVLRGVLAVDADLIEIHGSVPENFRDVARTPRKQLITVYRPLFREWWMEVPITYNATMLGQADVVNLFDVAGFAVGFGCKRPECKCTNGRFMVER